MLKKSLVLILVICIAMPTGMVFAQESQNALLSDIQLTVDGSLIDKAVYVINGASYLPLKEVSSALNLSVEWNGDTKTMALESSQNTIEGELLEIAEDENKILEEEIETLKALLVKNGIKVPTKDSVVKYLNDEIKMLSREPKSYAMDITTGFESDHKIKDILGKEYSNYLLLNIYRSFNAGPGDTYIYYPAQGQYEAFKATLSPYNIKQRTFKHELVIYADGNEVFRERVTSEDIPKDIEVDIENAETIKVEFRAEDGSNFGGILLGNPRFTVN